MTERVALRFGATPTIGAGHAMRCLALAQALQDEGAEVVALAQEATPWVVRRYAQEGIRVDPIDVDGPDAVLATGARWAVVDGYSFDARYHRSLVEAGLRVLALDDNGETRRYETDLVLNQNAHADPAWYADRAPRTRLLLGTRYALLRREFTQRAAAPPRPAGDVRRVFVSLGGGAGSAALDVILDALAKLDVAEIDVVASSSAVGLDRARARDHVRVHVDVDDVAAIMARADFAIIAAGSTTWEAACLGVPAAAVVLAENQRPSLAHLARMGAIESLGEAPRLDASEVAARLRALVESRERRARLASVSHSLVDGLGATRVARVLLQGDPE